MKKKPANKARASKKPVVKKITKEQAKLLAAGNVPGKSTPNPK